MGEPTRSEGEGVSPGGSCSTLGGRLEGIQGVSAGARGRSPGYWGVRRVSAFAVPPVGGLFMVVWMRKGGCPFRATCAAGRLVGCGLLVFFILFLLS